MKRLLALAVVVFAVAATDTPARAALVIYTDANVVGFVPNSASATPTFLAAIGTPTEFINFQNDKFGNPTPVGLIAGTAFSNLVTFSSQVSSIGFGGSNSTQVFATGSGIASEVGPASGFNGTLVIDFLANGQTARIVGFGPVEFGTAEQIRVFDQNGLLVGTFAGVSNNTFTFFGVEGTAGTRIGRIELDGGFFAIQDLQFNAAPVPEPATLAVFGALAVGAFGLRRRLKPATTA